jgi:hypothetical protein
LSSCNSLVVHIGIIVVRVRQFDGFLEHAATSLDIPPQPVEATPTHARPTPLHRGDGLDDVEEAAAGTDPTLADSDGDGLSDGDELYVTFTDPTDDDTDGDSLSDGGELSSGLDPRNADTDHDGLWDDLELLGTETDPLDADSDDGGTLDGAEQAHTAALLADARQKRLLEASVALAAAQSEGLIASEVLDLLIQLSGAERGFVGRVEANNPRGWRFLAARALAERDIDDPAAAVSTGIIRAALGQGEIGRASCRERVLHTV